MKLFLTISLSILAIMQMQSMNVQTLAHKKLQQSLQDGAVLKTVCFVLSEKVKLANIDLELIKNYDSKSRKYSDSKSEESNSASINENWQEVQDNGWIFDPVGELQHSYTQKEIKQLALEN